MQSTTIEEHTKQQHEEDFDLLMRMARSPAPHEVQNFGIGLIFDPRGVIGIAQVAGFIRGLALSDMKQAVAASSDFMSQLCHLADYGGTVDDEGIDSKVPRYRVSISHDNTFLGFNLAWLAAKKADHEGASESETTLFSYRSADGTSRISRYRPWDDGYNTWTYEFAFNGGLLYRGPAAGEVYSVHLGNPRFWSIHT